jgi:hypothetical protein
MVNYQINKMDLYKDMFTDQYIKQQFYFRLLNSLRQV